MRFLTFWLLAALGLFASERIVTLSPAISEMVYALGEGDAVAGVSEYASYPPEVKTKAKIGGYFSPSLERVLSLRPTLVIGHHQHEEVLGKLKAFGVDTLHIDLSRIGDIEAALQKLGSRLKREKEAAALVEAIEQAKFDAPKLPEPQSVLVVFGIHATLTRQNFVAGHDLYFEEILQICGAENAFSDDYAAQPILGVEGIIATAPEQVIIMHYPLTDGDVDLDAALQMWKELPIPAAKSGKIRIVDNDYLAIPSHRVAQSIRTFCEVITRD